MNTSVELTQELLKEILEYNPDTGHLTWLSNKYARKVWVGGRAGSLRKNGYREIKLFKKTYKEHRLIWFMVYGYWPKVVDHINHVRDDNRLSNLREVTHAENMRNLSNNSNTITGEQGIHYRNHKYYAVIKLNGKKVFQKSFDTFEEAFEERSAKLKELGFHKNHGKCKEIK